MLTPKTVQESSESEILRSVPWSRLTTPTAALAYAQVVIPTNNKNVTEVGTRMVISESAVHKKAPHGRRSNRWLADRLIQQAGYYRLVLVVGPSGEVRTRRMVCYIFDYLLLD